MFNIDLSGKNCIVTGGSKGIGKGIAEGLARAGANLAIVSRHFEEADYVAKKIKDKYMVNTFAIQADVSKINDIELMIKKFMKSYGKLDIIVNNAGISTPTYAIEINEDIWDSVLSVNLKGCFFCAQEAAKQMRRQGGGKIINIGSAACILSQEKFSHYAASKAGLSQLTKVLALEWAEYDILINTIAPGPVLTDINIGRLQTPESRQSYIDKTILKRFGTPDDISGMVIFLASEYSSYITGQTIFVDGGWSVKK